MSENLSKKCLSYCYRLLSMRDYSEFKLREKLREKGYPQEIVSVTIAEMKNFGFIKEDYYRQSKIKMRLKQGKAARFIREELKQEKISVTEEHLEEALLDLNLSQESILNDLLLKKTRNIDLATLDFESKQKLERKVIGNLVRLGHDFNSIKKNLDRMIREAKNTF